MTIIRLLILVLFPMFLSAQNSEIDSLETIISSNQADSTRLKAMLNLARKYRSINLQKALRTTEKGLALSLKLEREYEETLFLNILGVIYEDETYPLDTTINTYRKALILARTLGDELLIANIQNNMGNTYLRVGQYDKSFELYQNALEIAERLNDKPAACRYLNNIAVIMKERRDYQNALVFYNRSLKLAKELDNKAYTAVLANNIGLIYDELGKLDTALIYYKEALVLKRASKNKYRLVTTLTNIGDIYIKQSKLNTAFSYISEAYNISENLNYSYGKAITLAKLATYSIAKKDYEKAINYSKKGLEIIKVDGDIDLVQEFYELLMKGYEHLGDYKNAFHYQKEYQVIEDSVFNLESEKRIDELTTKYEVSKKEHENEVLKANERANKAVIRQRTWLFLAALVVIILLLSLLFFIYKNNEKKRQYRKNLENNVKEKTTALKSLNQELVERNIELERFNYAASHDMKEPLRSIISFSTLLSRREKNVLSTEGKQYLGFIRQNALQMNFLVESIKEFSNINERTEDEIDLNVTLKEIEADLEYDKFKLIHNKLPKLKGGKTQFFLLFKHLIDNGFQYNKSVNPVVKVEYIEHPIHHQFKIIDNGMGIDYIYQDQIFSLFKRLHDRGTSQKAGMGLATCKKIVQNLNGKIKVESELDKGTTFIIEIPKNQS